MRIYSMTATFGKLEQATLTLKPGLNIIHAPNEWGKSTWCAFLLAMLYGMDTRARSGRSGLTEKEHYAPWSGSPMSGRMELNWRGRNITIERSTKGRIPLGTFRAYETESGLEIPELTAANCGQMLLGVESSVFRRSGFIRLSDLPVTQDDALRRRLNALVTTGDESCDGIRLEKELRDLKNRCRYNRTGLLPQAEQERDALQNSLRELTALEQQQDTLLQNQEDAKLRRRKLENHQTALAYRAAQEQAAHILQAVEARDDALRALNDLETQCAALPSREEALSRLEQLTQHREALQEFQLWQQTLPEPPTLPKVPRPFLGVEPEDAIVQAEQDTSRFRALHSPWGWVLTAVGGGCLVGAAALAILKWWIYAAAAGAVGVLSAVLGIWRLQVQKKGRAALVKKYGSSDPTNWMRLAKDYDSAFWFYHRAESDYQNGRETLRLRKEEIRRRHDALCGSSRLEDTIAQWQEVLQLWDALPPARREAAQCEQQLATLQSMVRPAPMPAEPDDLTLSAEETSQELQQIYMQQNRLESLLGQCRGRMESCGPRDTLQAQLNTVENRIRELEKTYSALELAQQTLNQATAELQRRFAPRIAKRAQGLISRMTGGRYDRLTLASDLSLQAGATRENTLHDAQWRSEGTIDQLYLALRLAVAEELTPEAPLILDDALVRFDETRMSAAVGILRDLAESKQVILFTCQKREELAE